MRAYEARDPAKSGVYSFENATRKLALVDERQFQTHQAAWQFFQKQPPGYRRIAIWWVVSAKKDETRARRLAQLIEHSRNGRRLGTVTGKK